MTRDEVGAARTAEDGARADRPVSPGPGPGPDAVAWARDVALVLAFAALVALGARTSLDIDVVDVPITLQTGAVLLAGAVLGPVRGTLAVVVYLLVGLAGYPVFAGGGSGAEHLAEASAGYLLAMPVAAAVTGWIAYRHRALRPSVTTSWIALGCLAGVAATYAVGIPVMVHRLDLSGMDIVLASSVFLPFDLAKCALVTLVAAVVHRLLPSLLRA